MYKMHIIILFILNLGKIDMHPIFKSIILNNEKNIIINQNAIYIYNKESHSIINNYIFDFSSEISFLDIDKISYFLFSPNSGDKFYFILIKNYIYILSSEGEFRYKYIILDNAQPSFYSITPFKFTNSDECEYFMQYIYNDLLIIKLYKFNFVSNLNELLNNFEGNIFSSSGNRMKIASNNFSCELMKNSNNDNLLTCFFQNENPKEIIASSFIVDTSNGNLINEYNTKTYLNNGAKIIKTNLSSDSKKSLVCYIDNSDTSNCLIYNLDDFSEININPPLNNCLSSLLSLFNIDKIIDTNQYYIYCFYSSTEFGIIKLDNNFEVIDNSKDFLIKEDLVEDCPEYYFTPLFDSNINAILNCNKGKFTFSIEEVEEEYANTIIGKSNIPLLSIKRNANNILKSILPGNIYNIKGDKYNIKISPIGNKQGTYIEFLSCEEKIQNLYTLNNLILVQVEVNMNEENSLTNKIFYSIFDENKNEVDLSICSNDHIKINYKIKDNSPLNTTMVLNFANMGVDILNINDPFFNDICFVFSINNLDVILKDRIKHIYQNYSYCDSDCTYENINLEKNIISCSCSINHLDNIQKNDASIPIFKQKILGKLQESTFGVIKCYKLVFTKSKLRNIGFWTFCIGLICRCIFITIYFHNGISPIKKYISEEMIKYHYISKEDNKNDLLSIPSNVNINSNLISINVQKKKKKKKKKIKIKIKRKVLKKRKEIMPTSSEEIIQTDNRTNKNIKETSDSNKNIKNNNNNALKRTYTFKEIIEEEIMERKKVSSYYNLIKIDANNSSEKELKFSKYTVDNNDYELALIYENRSFCRILWIFYATKNDLLNTFCIKSPLNLRILRINLLLMSIGSDFIFNSLFYFSDNISDQYHYEGENKFSNSFLLNLFSTIISTCLSMFITFIFQMLTESNDNLEEGFREEEAKMRKDDNYIVSNERKFEIKNGIIKTLKILKIKIIIFIFLDSIIHLFSSYYMIAFCEVYKNTQINWFTDSISSTFLSFFAQILTSFILTILYKISLKCKCCLFYKIVLFFI